MPIVVDPGFAWPPEVDPVVSPDGRLTAIVDPAHAGVLLRADFDDSVPDTPAVPEKVLRRNLATNPSFEAGVSGWQSTAGTSLDQQISYPLMAGKVGGALAEVRVTSASYSLSYLTLENRSASVTVGPGQWVGARFWAASDRGLNTRMQLRFGPTYSAAPSKDATFYPGSYFSHVAQVPAGETEAWVQAQILSPDSSPISTGKRLWLDQVLLVVADTKEAAEAQVATYFDGSTATSGEKRYRWAGTPHASISEEYTPATPFIPGKPGTVAKVRFERQDGTVVRSGNPAWAPGGYAHAYDHEATLGGGTLWRAVPIRFDGTEGEPSEYVGAVIPALSDGWAWLKPVADPDKAMLLKVEPPDLSYDGRVDTTSIAGAPRPAATWDVLEGFTTQLRSLVREKDVEKQLMALLDEGPVLAQFPACAGLPDFYFIRGKLDLEHVHWDGWPWRRYQWDAIQIDRPDTTDSPLRIPGLSYDTVARDWTTYDQLKSTVESYNKLLEP